MHVLHSLKALVYCAIAFAYLAVTHEFRGARFYPVLCCSYFLLFCAEVAASRKE